MRFRNSFVLFVIVLSSLAIPGRASAQMMRVDSLRTLLKAEGKTTVRADHLIGLAFAISDAEFATEYDEFVNSLEEANALATQLHYAAGLAYASMGPAFRAMEERRYVESIAGYKECIARLDAAGIEQGMVSPLADIRRVYTAAGLQQERFVFYSSALDRYRREGPALNTAICEHGLGGYYLSIQQYGQAIERYMKAREGFRKAAAWSDVANETGVIGQCYMMWGDPDRAMPFLREALEAFLREKKIDQAMSTTLDLGDVECGRGDTLKGLEHFRSTRP